MEDLFVLLLTITAVGFLAALRIVGPWDLTVSGIIAAALFQLPWASMLFLEEMKPGRLFWLPFLTWIPAMRLLKRTLSVQEPVRPVPWRAVIFQAFPGIGALATLQFYRERIQETRKLVYERAQEELINGRARRHNKCQRTTCRQLLDCGSEMLGRIAKASEARKALTGKGLTLVEVEDELLESYGTCSDPGHWNSEVLVKLTPKSGDSHLFSPTDVEAWYSKVYLAYSGTHCPHNEGKCVEYLDSARLHLIGSHLLIGLEYLGRYDRLRKVADEQLNDFPVLVSSWELKDWERWIKRIAEICGPDLGYAISFFNPVLVDPWPDLCDSSWERFLSRVLGTKIPLRTPEEQDDYARRA